jgi:hypothetical protein
VGNLAWRGHNAESLETVVRELSKSWGVGTASHEYHVVVGDSEDERDDRLLTVFGHDAVLPLEDGIVREDDLSPEERVPPSRIVVPEYLVDLDPNLRRVAAPNDGGLEPDDAVQVGLARQGPYGPATPRGSSDGSGSVARRHWNQPLNFSRSILILPQTQL